MAGLDELRLQVAPLRQSLLEHPVYEQIQDISSLGVFMQQHVFAVWDFMSLLKALQRQLCCVDVPWLPPANRLGCRLINEIALAEESDLDGQGGFASHFELYRGAMVQLGTSPHQIDTFLARLGDGCSLASSLEAAAVHDGVAQFVTTTFELIRTGDVCGIAAAFYFGREDLLPDVFLKLVEHLKQLDAGRVATLDYYLRRHIELDADEHGPLAERLISDLCGEDEHRWRTAGAAAVAALDARRKLFDGACQQIRCQRDSGQTESAPPIR